MKKAWIIAFFFLSLQSCGSYEIVSLNHKPVKQVRVIVEHDYQPYWNYPLLQPNWRYRYINPYTIPRVRVVAPSKTRVRVRGSRGQASRGSQNTSRKRND